MHVERRLHPRLNTDLGGEIHCQGESFLVRVINLSLSGLVVEGEGPLAALFASGGAKTLELALRFSLEGQQIQGRCRVVYRRRLSINRVALGLNILSLDDQPQTEALIDRHIRRHLGG